MQSRRSQEGELNYDEETSKGRKIAALNAHARNISRFHLRDLFANDSNKGAPLQC